MDLTRTEFDLLALFQSSPRRVLTPTMILRELWHTDFVDDDRAVEVYIHRLRRKLGESGRASVYIHTVRGVGYRFEPHPLPAQVPNQVLYDKTGILVLVTSSSEDLLGWPIHEVVGTRFIPSANRIWQNSWVITFMNKLAADAGLESFTISLTLKDRWGEDHPTHAEIRFVKSEGVVHGVQVSYRNAGGRKE